MEQHLRESSPQDDILLSCRHELTAKQLLTNEQDDDSFFVCNLDEVVRRHKLWQKLLPRVEPHYAVKCNNDPVALQLLNQMGVGFDCASKNEIKQVLELGASPSRIVYAHPCKQVSSLKYARKMNVDLMTFDSDSELHKIKALYPNARLLIRVLPPSDNKTLIPLGQKFGCHQNCVSRLLEEAKTLRLNVVGVSFHVGSMCSDESAFTEAIYMARELFNTSRREGFEMNLLDIGGGFPGHNTGRITIEKICEALVPALDKHFPPSAGVRIIAEPGRFYVTTAYTLYVTIIGKKTVYDDGSWHKKQIGDNKSFLYHVNDGLFGCFSVDMVLKSINCEKEERNPLLSNPSRYVNKPLYKSSVWGPTCCPADCILSDILLPELLLGDWLIFCNMGAYTSSLSSNFNGMPKAQIFYTKDTNENTEP